MLSLIALVVGITAGDAVLIEHCIEKSEDSEPFCFIESIHADKVQILTLEENIEQVKNVQLSFPEASSGAFKEIANIPISLQIISEADYFGSVKDLFGSI